MERWCTLGKRSTRSNVSGQVLLRLELRAPLTNHHSAGDSGLLSPVDAAGKQAAIVCAFAGTTQVSERRSGWADDSSFPHITHTTAQALLSSVQRLPALHLPLPPKSLLPPPAPEAGAGTAVARVHRQPQQPQGAEVVVVEEEKEEEEEAEGADGRAIRRHSRRRVRIRRAGGCREQGRGQGQAGASEGNDDATGLVLSDSESEESTESAVSPRPSPRPHEALDQAPSPLLSVLSVPLPGHEQLEHACLRVELQVCGVWACACINNRGSLHSCTHKHNTPTTHHHHQTSRRSTARCSAAQGRCS